MGQDDPYEYEIDLRDYLEVIWQEKWFITLIFVIAAGAAFGFSELQPPRYETNTTLLITPRVSEQLVKGQDGGLASSTLPVNVYKESAMADDLIRNIIDGLDLSKDGSGEPTVSALQEKMEVTVELSEKNSERSKLPLVTMTVTGGKAERIERIANKWADLFMARNTELLSSETARSYEFISGRFQEVSENLTEKEQDKLDYKREHPLELLQSEVEVLRWKYQDFLSQLQSKRADLKEKTARLTSLKQILKEEPRFLQLKRSIPEESLWRLFQGLAGEKEGSEGQAVVEELKNLLDVKVQDQEINQVYYNLKETQRNLQSDVSSLEEQIDYLEDRTEELSQDIEAKQFEIDQTELKIKQLDREIKRLNDTYNTLSANLEEARIANQEKESSIRVMERAVAPETPVGSNTRQNVAVAGVLGLFLGVLAAFFKNYMQGYESDQETGEEQDDPE